MNLFAKFWEIQPSFAHKHFQEGQKQIKLSENDLLPPAFASREAALWFTILDEL